MAWRTAIQLAFISGCSLRRHGLHTLFDADLARARVLVLCFDGRPITADGVDDAPFLLYAVFELLLRSMRCRPEVLHVAWQDDKDHRLQRPTVLYNQAMLAALAVLGRHRADPACQLRSLTWTTPGRVVVSSAALHRCLLGGDPLRDLDLRCRLDEAGADFLSVLGTAAGAGHQLALTLDCTAFQRQFNQHLERVFRSWAEHPATRIRTLALTLTQACGASLLPATWVALLRAVAAMPNLRRLEVRLAGTTLVEPSSPAPAPTPAPTTTAVDTVVLDVGCTGLTGATLCHMLALLPPTRRLTVLAEGNAVAAGARLADVLPPGLRSFDLHLSAPVVAQGHPQRVTPTSWPAFVRVHWRARTAREWASMATAVADVEEDGSTTGLVWSH